MFFYLSLSLVVLLYWLFVIKEALAFKKISREFLNFPKSCSSQPKLSVILSAKDEEANLKKTLLSLSQQTYKNMEVIMIDDRSQDKTGLIMESFSEKLSHFKKISIKELPPKWLGKTHALQQGYLLSEGDYLLFTDADVSFQPECLEESMNFLLEKKLDHLSLAPELKSKSLLLSAFQILFATLFLSFSRPSKIPSARSYAGVGAFNLIKKSVYQKIGEHKRLRLEVVDDMNLGRLLFEKKFKSLLANGKDFLHIYWYHSPRELLKGLEKNLFAGLDYSLFWFLLVQLFFLTVFYLPFLMLFLAPNFFLKLCFLGPIILMQMVFFQASRELFYSPLSSFLTPFATLLFHYNFNQSVVKILWKQQITWRNSSYSLRELKEAHSKIFLR